MGSEMCIRDRGNDLDNIHLGNDLDNLDDDLDDLGNDLDEITIWII